MALKKNNKKLSYENLFEHRDNSYLRGNWWPADSDKRTGRLKYCLLQVQLLA
jgi:hypothetical protein